MLECDIYIRPLLPFKVLAVQLHPVTDDSFGCMKGGHLLPNRRVQKRQIVTTEDPNQELCNDGQTMTVNDIEAEYAPRLCLDGNRECLDPNTADQDSLLCIPAHDPSGATMEPLISLFLQVADA